MGYMGFGMQKWIYSLKPRKPFSKDRKDSYSTIGRNQDKSFSVEDFRAKRNSLKDKVTFLDKFKSKRIYKPIIYIILLLIATCLFYLFLFLFKKVNSFIENEKIKQELIEIRRINSIDKSYQLMLDYGSYYLSKKSYGEAIFEFEQAIKLQPEKIEAKIGLANVFYEECLDNNKNCDLALAFYNDLIKDYNYSNENFEELIFFLSKND